ncbi:MAG: LamG domain-containing protein [Patescibacteria group bacterium]
MSTNLKTRSAGNGFTIVELLIVVVVIAILAAITIVAYNGISNRAKTSTLKSEVAQSVKKIESAKVVSGNDTYPIDQSSAGLTDPSGETIYGYDPITNSYCVQSKKGSESYYSTNINTIPQAGECINSSVGMVGWWKFNNNTTDSSTSGLVGTPVGLTSIAGQTGAANTAYSFDGTTSFMSVPYNSAFSTNVQTVSTWIYPTSQSTTALYVSKRTAAGNGWMLSYLGATNGVSYDCGGSGARYTTGYQPTLNTWTHLVATCTSDGLISVYANGAKLGTLTVNTVGLPTANGGLYIGRDSLLAQYYFPGRLDDVRLYSRVLTDSEVTSLYTSNAQ